MAIVSNSEGGETSKQKRKTTDPNRTVIKTADSKENKQIKVALELGTPDAHKLHEAIHQGLSDKQGQ